MTTQMRLIFCFIGVLTGAALAQSSGIEDFRGTWAMKVAGKNLFVLTLDVSRGVIHGTYVRPGNYSMVNTMFADIHGIRTDTVSDGKFRDGALHLVIQNAHDPDDKDKCMMRLSGDHAEFALEDLPPGVVITPRVFVRAPAGASVATDWQPNRGYSASDSDEPNAEMTAIFDADQNDRTSAPTHIDWDVVGKSDTARREQTRKLLAAGALHTGKDYEHAAFVFQHGGSSEDYLMAHTLAMVAVTKGDATAIWIAAATLDRYLQNVGRPQIFGTQFLTHAEGGKQTWTQEPYDRALVSDALRAQLGVPAQKIQELQLKAYAAVK
jgi:hypothetical protein